MHGRERQIGSASCTPLVSATSMSWRPVKREWIGMTEVSSSCGELVETEELMCDEFRDGFVSMIH